MAKVRVAGCCLLLLCMLAGVYQSREVKGLQGELAALQVRVNELERQLVICNAELQLRTHPEYMDLALRNWFDCQLRINPEQVRGMDGKFPRERSK